MVSGHIALQRGHYKHNSAAVIYGLSDLAGIHDGPAQADEAIPSAAYKTNNA